MSRKLLIILFILTILSNIGVAAQSSLSNSKATKKSGNGQKNGKGKKSGPKDGSDAQENPPPASVPDTQPTQDQQQLEVNIAQSQSNESQVAPAAPVQQEFNGGSGNPSPAPAVAAASNNQVQNHGGWAAPTTNNNVGQSGTAENLVRGLQKQQQRQQEHSSSSQPNGESRATPVGSSGTTTTILNEDGSVKIVPNNSNPADKSNTSSANDNINSSVVIPAAIGLVSVIALVFGGVCVYMKKKKAAEDNNATVLPISQPAPIANESKTDKPNFKEKINVALPVHLKRTSGGSVTSSKWSEAGDGNDFLKGTSLFDYTALIK